tara:strand:- start:1904 stop:2110 length:207 start_codon:yes stop_codon:yes gene_type:complete
MPNFKKSSGFEMKGSTFYGKSPFKKNPKDKKKRMLNPKYHKQFRERGYDMSKWDPITGLFIPKDKRNK